MSAIASAPQKVTRATDLQTRQRQREPPMHLRHAERATDSGCACFGSTFAVGAVLPLLLILLMPVTALVWVVSGSSLFFLEHAELAAVYVARGLDANLAETCLVTADRAQLGS